MEIKDGVPCEHKGCLNHVRHPCEGCGRKSGRNMTEFNDKMYQLKINRNGDMVNISIGVELLTYAVLHGPALGGDPELVVTDNVKFTEEIINWLRCEDEDGTTPLHRAFDQAALSAVENGCDGIKI